MPLVATAEDDPTGPAPASVAGTVSIDSAKAQQLHQVCRYLVKDFGTSQSPKSTRQRDSRYCP
ncbi:MAG: hypothetical protein G8D28_06385, partial [gamma proteobacterium symbiont of Phacoides pectinatus]